jgi:hypothetical protein
MQGGADVSPYCRSFHTHLELGLTNGTGGVEGYGLGSAAPTLGALSSDVGDILGDGLRQCVPAPPCPYV